MSDTKINIKSNKDNTVSISVEMEVKPSVWSRKYTKFLPNEDYQRFHWTDAAKYLKKEGYDVETSPTAGPVKINNTSKEANTGTWVFKLKKPKATPKPKAAPKPKLKSTPVKKTTPQSKEA